MLKSLSSLCEAGFRIGLILGAAERRRDSETEASVSGGCDASLEELEISIERIPEIRLHREDASKKGKGTTARYLATELWPYM